MATLTEAAYYTRRGLKFVFLALLALILLRIIINGVSSIWQNVYKTPPPKPNVAFGKLPAIKFPLEKAPVESITYTQEFVRGVLPESSSSARVYFTPKPAPNFLSLGRAREFAQDLGFKTEPVGLSETLYQWTDQEYPLRTLRKDIIVGNFILNFDFYKDPTILKDKDLPYGKSAISEAMNFLGRYGLTSPDLKESGAKVSFWKREGAGLLPVSSVSEAEIVRVDLFRSTVDNRPLLTASYSEASVYFLFSGSSGKKRILTLRYTFRPIEKEIIATYPLKTTRQAWEELVAGKGYIASWGAVKGTHVTIRHVALAYYDSEEYEPYLQPIFVFEGDEGFKVYIPAIAKDWVE